MQSLHISPASTVNDVIAHCAATIPVFNAFGIDACCGGAVSIEEAARRDGVALGPLLEALEEAAAAAEEAQ